MKILTVVGARPQFIKAAALSAEIRKTPDLSEIMVHTGQHYDEGMSDVFFRELEIPEPRYRLGVGSLSHGAQTGKMLEALEPILSQEKPDWVLVYGDTNSTLAGALAAAKLHFKVAHVEAGLRSFNRAMPEEINRVVADHVSSLLLCPSQTAADHLRAEGVLTGVHVVGDVMAEALQFAATKAKSHSQILPRLKLQARGYLLATLHRAENTDDPSRLRGILTAFNEIAEPVIFPVHPRTRSALTRLGFKPEPHVRLLEPVGYLDMAMLEQSARLILTDSGGIQKEAYWLGVPCVTLRDETEWVETVDAGWNVLAGADSAKILNTVRSFTQPATRPLLYGDGQAARKCVTLISERFQQDTVDAVS